MIYTYITIEGGIGAGKTTLAKKFAHQLNARLILEEFEDNPFLAKFYADPERFAFPLELSFLANRYKQLQRILLRPDMFKPSVVADYSFYKSLVFAENTLPSDELKVFRQFFFILSQQVPQPSLIIYLYTTPSRLKQQILQRGRVFEQNISESYLESIQQGYLSLLKQIQNIPILVIDMKGIDFVKNEKDYQFLYSLIEIPHEKGLKWISYP
ncbi:MAG: deoxynucleoside kinase [Bacteroidales bacterium]|nr:deoxynucleoside kinase [Bacteroidales bacterium]